MPELSVPVTSTGRSLTDRFQMPNFNSSSLSHILKKLQDTNHLPQTLTPANIDNSIRTLVKILNNLKKSQKVAETPSQYYNEEDDYEDDGAKSVEGK